LSVGEGMPVVARRRERAIGTIMKAEMAETGKER